MKRMSKLLATALALVMLLCLCACGDGGSGLSVLRMAPETFETRITRANEQMQNLKSLQMDMHLDMVMTMSVMGESMNVNISADTKFETERDPLKTAVDLDMTIDAMGEHENQKVLSYILQEGSQYVTYTSSDEGRSWQKQTLSASEALQSDAEAQLQMFLANAASFQEAGTLLINGSKAIAYSGELTGNYVQEAVQSSGALNSVGELLGSEVTDDLFRDLDPISVTVAFDEQSGMMVFYEMDMTAAMGTLMQRLMDQLLQAAASGMDLQLSIDLPAVKVSVTLSRFDQVSVTVPDAVPAA